MVIEVDTYPFKREELHFLDIPELVQPPQITEGNRPRSFELTWNVAGENKASFAEPIIYVLQVRTYFGPEFDPMAANAWKTLTMVCHYPILTF